MYVKGDGTPLNIAIVTGNFSDIPDYNNWQFTVSTTSNWTLVQIPFSSFTIPYGTYRPFDLTRAEDIQWKIDEDGAFDVEIDDVMFYYPQLTYTWTATYTPTTTITPTPTSTFIKQTELNINEIQIYPNPYNYKKGKLRLFLNLSGLCNLITVKIYTESLRLIKTIKKNDNIGEIIEIGENEFKNLSNGLYLIIVTVENNEKRINSHIQELIILR